MTIERINFTPINHEKKWFSFSRLIAWVWVATSLILGSVPTTSAAENSKYANVNLNQIKDPSLIKFVNDFKKVIHDIDSLKNLKDWNQRTLYWHTFSTIRKIEINKNNTTPYWKMNHKILVATLEKLKWNVDLSKVQLQS